MWAAQDGPGANSPGRHPPSDLHDQPRRGAADDDQAAEAEEMLQLAHRTWNPLRKTISTEIPVGISMTG